MYWKPPHKIKLYEAITAIADKRINFLGSDKNKATCVSSSGNKQYEISWDAERMAIMSNDNSAFYTDTLSYPMIAFLMLKGILPLPSEKLLEKLKGIHWKDLNQKYRNDYDKLLKYIDAKLLDSNDGDELCRSELEVLCKHVKQLNLSYLGSKQKPPDGY